MSKLKKKAFTVILGGALSVMSYLPVFAAEPGISPHVQIAPCNQCRIGTVYKNITEEYRRNQGIGVVEYKFYYITVTSQCNNCTYNDFIAYEERRL